jgi:RNA polymerase sigma-70 factor (ECF subfamily)
MENTSLSLLTRVRQSGDPLAWSRLVEIYTPLLQRWCQTYDVQAADADDVIQEVLAAVVSELPEFQHNQRTGAFRAWLRLMLVNRLRRFWRARDAAPQAPGGSTALERLNELADDASPASRIWDAEHDQQVIASLLAAIRPHFQPQTWEAFQRQMFDGQPPDQVAEELQMSLSSVYVARSRVLSALRREAAGLVASL